MQPTDPLQLLTVPDVAGRLRISLTATWRLVHTGEIASLKIGWSRRVTPEAVAAFITRQAGGGSADGHAAGA